MSESVGACVPFSILLTRVKCCPVAAASARAVRPASLRTSRMRAPSAFFASLADLAAPAYPGAAAYPAELAEPGGLGSCSAPAHVTRRHQAWRCPPG